LASCWRDEAISQRHRLWGFNCPAVDIDFLMIEYDQGKPAACVSRLYEIRGRELDQYLEAMLRTAYPPGHGG
jgi:hypothetical protein